MRGSFDLDGARDRLRGKGGGYEIVHASPGMEIGVYVPQLPDPQQPHEADEAYVVLEGQGVLTVAGERIELRRGEGAFVPARVEHTFSEYEPAELVLLVVFQR